MIVVVYGTTGELIKLAPVLKRLEEERLPYLALSTHQQATQIAPMCREFGIAPPSLVLGNGFRGNDLSESWQIPIWALRVAFHFVRRLPGLRRQLRQAPGRHHLVVHGDTMTSVLGTLMARALGLPVAHVEAGLRSHDWRNPFPEELNRRWTGRVASVHYPPNEDAVANLAGTRGRVVPTGANTVLDSLRLVPELLPTLEQALSRPVPSGAFGIVSVHRFELLAHERRLRELLELMAEESRRTPLLFIDHPVTVAKVRQYGLDGLFDGVRFARVPRQSYLPFIALLRRSAFLITDSGGVQEECYYLDKPCLVHRMEVERSEGLGSNVLLSRFDLGLTRGFLDDPSAYRRGDGDEWGSPSEVVIADFVAHGTWPARA